MLRPSARKTQRPRVIGAIVFAFAFPPVTLILLAAGMSARDGPEEVLVALATLPAALVLSLLAGWIFVLPACAAWAILHQFDRHHLLAALLVGLTAGAAFGALLNAFGEDHSQDVMALLGPAATGVLTGLGVWWIAYGRQDRLHKPIITRPPLNL